MVVLAEFAIHRRAAVAAVSGEIGFRLAGRDIENRHVTAGLGRRAVDGAATQENGRVRDDGETMRMTAELVQLDELVVFVTGRGVRLLFLNNLRREPKSTFAWGNNRGLTFTSQLSFVREAQRRERRDGQA